LFKVQLTTGVSDIKTIYLMFKVIAPHAVGTRLENLPGTNGQGTIRNTLIHAPCLHAH